MMRETIEKGIRDCEMRLIQKFVAGKMDSIGNPVDPMLSERPVACVNAVTNGGKD